MWIVEPRTGALAPIVVPAGAPVVASAFAPAVCVPALAPLMVPRGRAAVARTRRAGLRGLSCRGRRRSARRRGSRGGSGGVVPCFGLSSSDNGGRGQGRTRQDSIDVCARGRALGSQGGPGLRVEVVGGLEGGEDAGGEQAGSGGRVGGGCAARGVGVVGDGLQRGQVWRRSAGGGAAMGRGGACARGRGRGRGSSSSGGRDAELARGGAVHIVGEGMDVGVGGGCSGVGVFGAGSSGTGVGLPQRKRGGALDGEAGRGADGAGSRLSAEVLGARGHGGEAGTGRGVAADGLLVYTRVVEHGSRRRSSGRRCKHGGLGAGTRWAAAAATTAATVRWSGAVCSGGGNSPRCWHGGDEEHRVYVEDAKRSRETVAAGRSQAPGCTSAPVHFSNQSTLEPRHGATNTNQTAPDCCGAARTRRVLPMRCCRPSSYASEHPPAVPLFIPRCYCCAGGPGAGRLAAPKHAAFPAWALGTDWPRFPDAL